MEDHVEVDERRQSSPRLQWSAMEDHARRIGDLERGAVVLFGHAGQPGSLTMLTSRLDQHEGRLGTLERAHLKLAGAVILAGSLTGIIVLIIGKLWR